MEHGCEHTEGSPIGKCTICERTVCSDCYRDLFGTMICDLHEELEEESAWELVAMYADGGAVAETRFLLDDRGITSLVVDLGEDAIELYVPGEEKADAFAALAGSGDGLQMCGECEIQFSASFGECPVCGEPPVESAEDDGDS